MSSISADIINYLIGKTWSQSEIATMLGTYPSFISRVKNGERNLTFEHLLKIEQATKQILPLIILEARFNGNSLTNSLREEYKTLLVMKG